MSVATESDRVARLGAASGWLSAALNLAGVVFLREIPAAYKPGTIPTWLNQSLAHPTAATASAIAFTAGVLLLVPFAIALERSSQGARPLWAGAGAILVALGGIMNATGTLLPLVAIGPLAAVGDVTSAGFLGAALALLAWSLTMDACFNALFGAGLVAFGVAMLRDPGRSRIVAWLGIVAGLATIPVALQPVSQAAADWLAVAGVLWLGWLVWTSASLWRQGRR